MGASEEQYRVLSEIFNLTNSARRRSTAQSTRVALFASDVSSTSNAIMKHATLRTHSHHRDHRGLRNKTSQRRDARIGFVQRSISAIPSSSSGIGRLLS